MKGKQKSARDMVLSLGLIVLAAGVMWLFIPHDDSEPDIRRVDYRVELLSARRAASYPVVAPVGLSEEWKATSVRYRADQSDAWHLGFSAPDGEYVAVEQSTDKPEKFIDKASQGARRTEATEEIGGRTWVRYEGGRYDALVLQDGDGAQGATTLVTGTASFERLAAMAAALETE